MCFIKPVPEKSKEIKLLSLDLEIGNVQKGLCTHTHKFTNCRPITISNC